MLGDKKRRCLFGVYGLFFSFCLLGVSIQTTKDSSSTMVDAKANTASTYASTGSAVKDKLQNTPKPSQTNQKNSDKNNKNTWKLKTKKFKFPKKMIRGAGYTIEGTIQSDIKMKRVTAKIINKKGTVLYRQTITKNGKKALGKKVSIYQFDEKMKFSNLKAGTYSFVIEVTNVKGAKKKVVNRSFQIKKAKWAMPISNYTMGDGWHCHCSYHGGRHYGWDLKGKNIRAASDGEVVYAKYHGGGSLGSFGKLIILYHGNGIYSYYAHCSQIKVKVGKKVEQGQIIGIVGSTGLSSGPHLHFELRKGPVFKGGYNAYKLVDKYTYKQFNPAKKIKRK